MAEHIVASAPLLALIAGSMLGSIVLATAMGSSSATAAVVAIGLLGFAIVLLVLRQVQRPLLAALFFLAPVDISKAVIAPITSLYFPAGPYYSPGLYLSLAHVALLALLAVWLGKRIVMERRWPPMTRLDWLAFAYLAFIWVRSIGADQGILSIGSAISYSLAVLAFYIASHAIRDISDLRTVIRASTLVLLLTIVYVALQSAIRSPLPLPGSKALAAGAMVSFGGAGEVFRPSGFMNHPNALAHYVVILLPPTLALVLLGSRRVPSGVWRAALALTLGGGFMLLVTLSRGGWASFALAVAVLTWIYLRRGLLAPAHLGLAFVAVLGGVLAVVALFPEVLLRLTAPDNRSLESRVLLADMALTIIKANPFAGVGFGDYNRAAYEYSAPLFATVSPDYQFALHQLVVHNHFLLIAAELGVPAMLFFVYLLWRFARLPVRGTTWSDPGIYAITMGLAAGIAGQALFLNSDNYYVDIRVFLLWLSAGVLQALTIQSQSRGT